LIQLDLTPSADTPFFSHTTTLAGAQYTFDFAWSMRRAVWLVSMRTQDGEVLFLSQVARHGRNLLDRCVSPNAPAGVLVVWCDTPANVTPPGVDELGGRAGIYFATSADL
jgi:hypothetical protein